MTATSRSSIAEPAPGLLLHSLLPPRSMKVLVYTDGGSRGNPGPSAYGVVLANEEGKVLKQTARFLGEGTNNEAEYRGLIAGLSLALEIGADEVEVVR